MLRSLENFRAKSKRGNPANEGTRGGVVVLEKKKCKFSSGKVTTDNWQLRKAKEKWEQQQHLIAGSVGTMENFP